MNRTDSPPPTLGDVNALPEMRRSSSSSFDGRDVPPDRKLEHSASETSTSASMNDAASRLTNDTQLLRLETLSDKHARLITGAMKITVALSLAVIVIITILKEAHLDSASKFVLNRSYHWSMVILGIVLLCVVNAFALEWLRRLVVSWRLKKTWSRRRKCAVQSCTARALVMNVIIISYIFSNVMVLADSENYCNTPASLKMSQFIRWSGWNTLLFLLVVDGHGVMLREVDGREDGVIRDMPWSYHWPKLLIWLPIEGISIWLTKMEFDNGHILNITKEDGTCDFGARLSCDFDTKVIVATSLWAVLATSYCVLYFVYLCRAYLQLKGKLYQRYRIANLLLQLQFRFNGMIMVVWSTAMLCLWFFGRNACVNWSATWWGLVPLLLATSCLQCISFFLTQPRTPGDGDVAPSFVLQQFAWTERSKERKLARRRADATVASLCPKLVNAPMFCVETAIKLFFWSTIAYDYTEAEGHVFSNIPEEVKELLSEIEQAMGLFNLEKRHLFYDRQHETKVVVAWNFSTIIVCTRGSAQRANFVDDLKFLQTAHLPKRRVNGRIPRVHRGFLSTWHANGISERVIAHVSALLDSAADRDSVRLVTCGHSLGGAVATLAAFDFARRCNLRPEQISCYTFGCPRVGNHVFAQEYVETVPDTWHIINDQDIVAHGLKMFGWYKRNGQRAIVNGRGDLLVRPTFLELSLLQNPFSHSLVNHTNASYHKALFSILSAQLDVSQRHADGVDGLLFLLQDVPLLGIALKRHAEEQAISLYDRLATDEQAGTDLVREGSGLSAATMRWTPSARHKLLQDVGFVGGDEAAASPRSDGSFEGVPVSLDVDSDGVVSGGAPADMQSEGGARRITSQPTLSRDDPEEYASLGSNPLWGTACKKMSALSVLGRLAPHGKGRAPVDAPEAVGGAGPGATAVAMGARAGAATRRCYKIPEDSDGASAAAAAGDGSGSGGRWRCPLTAPKEKLPEGAKLDGNVLDMGATPCMHACKLGCPSRFKSGVAKKGQDAAAAAAKAPVEVPEAAQTRSMRETGYVDWLGKGLERISHGQPAAAPIAPPPQSGRSEGGVIENAMFETANSASGPLVK